MCIRVYISSNRYIDNNIRKITGGYEGKSI